MPYLIALLCFLGLLCLLNLIFTYGVILRLREHSEALAEGGGRRGSRVDGRPRPMGEVASDFTAITVKGQAVSRDSLPASAVVAFISPGCLPCEEAVPDLLKYATTVPDGQSRILVIVSGPTSESAAYVEQFADVADVVVEGPSGPVQSAFAVDGVPAFGVLGAGGTITVATRKVAELPTAVSA
ncbi:TlpA family protein disulfide reductase [Streptomyces cupreus]|uniref:Thioredoxin domain-containing protein n=1 Tax=Streptomyces cupreus TaxID=2759956 RepID=A0A7X1JEQ7_9ACTN|nr:hypothetical protein [Streptomyces cupreus]MBC2906762.1 hypothetical protein [Streptomyces cupreus]